MYDLGVDLSGLSALTKRYTSSLRALSGEVLALAKEGAKEEKSTKTYTNRTRNLIKSTKAYRADVSADGWTVVLEQGEFYGVYVQRRGFSDFTEIGIRTSIMVDAAVARAMRGLR